MCVERKMSDNDTSNSTAATTKMTVLNTKCWDQKVKSAPAKVANLWRQRKLVHCPWCRPRPSVISLASAVIRDRCCKPPGLRLVGWCLKALLAQICCATIKLCRAGDKYTIKPRTKPKNTEAFFNLVFVEIISSTQIGLLREAFLANQLASTDN